MGQYSLIETAGSLPVVNHLTKVLPRNRRLKINLWPVFGKPTEIGNTKEGSIFSL